MTSPSLENLPAELIGQATEQLLVARAFGSVTALGGCTRRLHAIVLPALYKHVTKVDLQTGEDALIRAVENDELGLLKVLLERGVDPNGRFWSTLPSSVRQEMFSAQGLSRRLSPRGDGYLVSKIIQENIVWPERCRPRVTDGSWFCYDDRFLRAWYLATVDCEIPESLPVYAPVRGWFTTGSVTELVKHARFGCRQPPHGTDDLRRHLYSWTAIHLATQRGSIQAVETLLAHGADIESRCQGLCDCLAPTWPSQDGREPPPTWSPLHLAVCFVHDRLVRRLLDHGANHMAVGWLATGHPTFVDAEDPGITALHRAALRGGVAMCQLLLDHHAAGVTEASGDMLERGEARGLRALDYAVAAGHTRTVGSWLLEHGADHLQHIALAERNFPAPLNFLCARQQYRDAHYLLDRIVCRPDTIPLPLTYAFRA